MIPCRGCGIVMHSGDFCWLCELGMSQVKEVYVNLGTCGKIIAWQSFKSDLCLVKLKTETFITIVQGQYREE